MTREEWQAAKDRHISLYGENPTEQTYEELRDINNYLVDLFRVLYLAAKVGFVEPHKDENGWYSYPEEE